CAGAEIDDCGALGVILDVRQQGMRTLWIAGIGERGIVGIINRDRIICRVEICNRVLTDLAGLENEGVVTSAPAQRIVAALGDLENVVAGSTDQDVVSASAAERRL